MDYYSTFLAFGLVLGVLVIAGYLVVYSFSAKGRQKIETPKYTMLECDKRLWPKDLGNDK